MSQHDLKGSWGGNVLTRKQHTARVSKMERERKWKFLPVVEDVFMLREKKKKNTALLMARTGIHGGPVRELMVICRIGEMMGCSYNVKI